MERGIDKRGAAIKMEEWWPGKENGKQGEENSQTARPVTLGGKKAISLKDSAAKGPVGKFQSTFCKTSVQS